MKEKNQYQSEMNRYTDKILILEAKVEIFEEEIEAFREKMKKKKNEKNELFSQRDKLITEKRILQQAKYETELHSQKDLISLKINDLSDKIGDIIEKSKALSIEIQAIYDESQLEYAKMIDTREKLRLLQKESNQNILSYKQKIAHAENELNNLRTKMGEIQEKLNSNIPND
jgi:uncharacterized coiled-coil DUF342 family protein